jgi:plasmid replication initiation protein
LKQLQCFEVVFTNYLFYLMDDKRDKALQAISKDPYRLIKTNPIINARFDITAIQMKVFLKVIASIDQSKEDMTEVNISVKELQTFIGSESKNIYSYLQEELTKLRKKDLFYEDDRIRLEASFFSSIIYHKKEGYFTFEFSKNIKPFLLQIKDNFTVLDIRNLLYLDSIYAIRFYEYCKEFERFKHFEFDVDVLKENFGLSNRYKNYFDFKLKVLQQARTELMQNSELYFDFEEIKQGKKVTRLRFNIIKNNKNLVRKDDNEEMKSLIDEIHLLVKDFVSEATVITWFKKFSYEQIKKAVIYTLNEKKQGRVNDTARYLQKMVATPDLFDANEQKRNEQETKKKQVAQKQQIQQLEIKNTEERQEVKKQYFEAKVALANKIIESETTLFQRLMIGLREEVSQEKPAILSEMALNNYKISSKFKNDSLEEFIENFNHGGTFQSYVLERVGEENPHKFNDLKKKFIPKAEAVGLKETELI